MKLVPHLIPTAFTNIFEDSRSFFYVQKNTKKTASRFIGCAMRIMLAAGICLAVYKGSMLGAGILATFSFPVTISVIGLMAVKYGITALKAGIIAKQISQIALGAIALYVGWQALDNPVLIGCRDIFNLDRSCTICHLSERIAVKLGYTK